METFKASNLVKVGNFLKAIGFGEMELQGEIKLSVDDYLYLKNKLVELELRKEQDPFERIDGIPFSWELPEGKVDERSKN